MKLFLKTFVLVAFLGIVFSFQPTVTTSSLIIAHYDVQNLTTAVQHLYKYNFVGGAYAGKEKLLTIVGKKNGKDYIRCDIGANRIYRNRYLITGLGNIIDLESKKVVSDVRLNWIGYRGDSIIFFTNDAFKGKYYSYFDTKTNLLAEIKSPLFKALHGQDIEIDYQTQNRRIYLYPPSASKTLLINDAGYGEAMAQSDKSPAIPFHWIDNDNFIFPYYDVSRNNCILTIVNVKDKSQQRLEKIIDIPKSRENSYFDHDAEGNLEYVCAKGKFLIDIKMKKSTQVIFERIGNAFDVEYFEQPYGHAVKYQKIEIGKYHFDLRQIKSGKSYLALYKLLMVGKEFYPQGLNIWNSSTKQWTEIEADDVASIIGWIEK